MKRFKYSLQFYLDIKQKEEKAAMRELYAAQSKLNALEQEYMQLQGGLSAMQLKLNGDMTKGITPYLVSVYYSYFDNLKQQLKLKLRQIKKSREELEALRNKLVEIKKVIKMLNILKEKRYFQYLQEQQSEEAKALDDLINFKVTEHAC